VPPRVENPTSRIRERWGTRRSDTAYKPPQGYGLTVNETEFDPEAPHPFELVAVTDPVPTVLVPGRGLYT